MRSVTLPLVAVSLLALAHPGRAQTPTPLEEIIVTPRDGDPFTLAEEDPLAIETPAPITRIDGQEIRDREFRQLTDLQSTVPNIIARSGGARSLNDVFGFRGMVNTPFFGEPAVALYVDDVPYAGILGNDLNLFATERIDLFRGPQFTRFGKRGSTGLISVYHREPGDRLHAEGEAGFGSYNEQFYRLHLDGPITPTLGFAITGFYSKQDGFIYNRTHERDTDFTETLGGRFSLTWRPDDRWNIQLILSAQDYDDGVQRLTTLDSSPFEEDDDFAGVTHSRSDVEALRIRYTGDHFLLTSVTARRRFSLSPASLDLDFSSVDFASVTVDAHQLHYSQELRLQSLPESDWDWLIGGYLSYFDYDVEIYDRFYALLDHRVSNQTFLDRTAALFGEITVPLTCRLDLTAGLRAETMHKKADRTFRNFGGIESEDHQSRTVSNISPKLQLTFEPVEKLKLYVSSSLGYRSGTYSAFNFADDFLSIGTERTWANEVGVKGSFFKDRLQVSFAGFWYDVENYQMEKYLPNGFGVFSAPEVVSRGLELEVLARPWTGLELSANLGYTNARFREHTSTESGEDLSGNRPPYVPEITAAFGATYRHSSGVMARLEWLLTSRTYFDERNLTDQAQSGYGIVNAKIGYEQKHWGIYAFARNLGDTEYYSIKLYPFGVGAIGDPRTFGAMVTFDF
ncbi:MAG: TonB-dependent receptor [Chthoniobacteraceae bacterium]